MAASACFSHGNLQLYIIYLFVATACFGNPLGPLDDAAQSILRTSESPGIAVGTLFEGKQEIAVAGVRRNGSAPLIAKTDKWDLGSITKSMTSTLIARLAEKGVLSFDDTVGDVLGKFVPEMHPAYKSLTYRHLVSHRAGLRREVEFWVDRLLAGRLQDRDIKADRLIVSRAMLSFEPIVTPGTSSNYSNVGYVVAGTMIEVTTGGQWESLMRKEVFEPLGMKSTGFGAPLQGSGITQPYGHTLLPWGEYYVLDPNNPTQTIGAFPAVGPAGTVHANTGDVLKYLDAHRLEDHKFLSKKSWNILHTPVNGSTYAAGWGVSGNTVWLHLGSNGAWYALVGFSKQQKSQLVLCANYFGINGGPVHQVFIATWAKFFGLEL